jgi:hypothetical protein
MKANIPVSCWDEIARFIERRRQVTGFCDETRACKKAPEYSILTRIISRVSNIADLLALSLATEVFISNHIRV